MGPLFPGLRFSAAGTVAQKAMEGADVLVVVPIMLSRILQADDGELRLPSLRVIASSGSNFADRFINLWDAETGEELLVLEGHTAPLISPAFSPDGTRIATARSLSSKSLPARRAIPRV